MKKNINYVLIFILFFIVAIFLYKNTSQQKHLQDTVSDSREQRSPVNSRKKTDISEIKALEDKVGPKILYLETLSTVELLNLLRDKKYEEGGLPLLTILELISQKFSKSEFEQVFRVLNDFPDNRKDIANYLGKAAVHMIDLGEDVNTLVPAIIKLCPTGEIRIAVLRDLVRNAKFALDEAVITNLLKFTSERAEEDAILLGVRFRLSDSESLSDYKELLNTSNSKLRDEVLRGMSSYLTHCKMYIEGTYEARLQELMSVVINSKMKLSPKVMNSLVTFGDAEQALEFYKYLHNGSAEATLALANVDETLSRKIATNIAKESPKLACDTFFKQRDFGPLAASLGTWLVNNEAAALEWYNTNSSALDGPTKDILKAEIASVPGKKTVFEQWDLVHQISDPQAKKRAEGAVWNRELRIVRNWANENPQQAVAELVSGKSQHGAYWIEEAMDVWMTRNFDQAEQWYQDNWKSLPVEKSQFAAAAFAKQAIKAGDANAASQWLSYIKDPKTKSRIEGKIKAMDGQ